MSLDWMKWRPSERRHINYIETEGTYWQLFVISEKQLSSARAQLPRT